MTTLYDVDIMIRALRELSDDTNYGTQPIIVDGEYRGEQVVWYSDHDGVNTPWEYARKVLQDIGVKV